MAVEQMLHVVEKISKDHQLAYRPGNAAKVLDISYDSLRREVLRGKIFPTKTLNLFTKEELLRYLRKKPLFERGSGHEKFPDPLFQHL